MNLKLWEDKSSIVRLFVKCILFIVSLKDRDSYDHQIFCSYKWDPWGMFSIYLLFRSPLPYPLSLSLTHTHTRYKYDAELDP